MPLIKCPTCEEVFKSKVSLKKHNCDKKELTLEEKLEAVYKRLKQYDNEFELSLHLMKQDKDLLLEQLCKLLEKPKISSLIVKEEADIKDEVEEIMYLEK